LHNISNKHPRQRHQHMQSGTRSGPSMGRVGSGPYLSLLSATYWLKLPIFLPLSHSAPALPVCSLWNLAAKLTMS